MEAYQERVVAEHSELRVKTGKLRAFLDGEPNVTDGDELRRLRRQCVIKDVDSYVEVD